MCFTGGIDEVHAKVPVSQFWKGCGSCKSVPSGDTTLGCVPVGVGSSWTLGTRLLGLTCCRIAHLPVDGGALRQKSVGMAGGANACLPLSNRSEVIWNA